MNKLLLGSLATVLFVSSNVNGQATGCNHYYTIPFDVCYQYSTTYDYMYSCNGTDSYYYGWYTQGESCSDESYVNSYSYSISDSDTSVECDNTDNCGYFQVVCDTYSNVFILTDVCYSSYEYSCSGTSGVVSVESYTSNDCSGDATSYDYDYSDYYTDCTFVCEGGSGSSANTLSIQFALLFSFLAVIAKLF